ncbi:MAG: rhodanese-like domain-containing protein [Candidatus Sumerlaeaceae bacterium]|nr:rhodanese-like domain-containing protein [Candidatus Sumerlaeaceae bacterium]
MKYQTITPGELYEKMKQGWVDLRDVRTPAEFESVHIPGATNCPLDKLNEADFQKSLLANEGGPVYLICKAGSRAVQAAEKCTGWGHPNVVIVEGCMQRWEAENLPVLRGTKRMSLDCQFRIVVGSLVLTGVLLGTFVHPAALVIPAFVGLGLIVAGIRDSCPMANVLARMPWNQASAPSCCAPTQSKNA